MKRYRALLEAVLAGVPVDTCPVFFWKHHPEADQQPDTLGAATLAFQAQFDCDIVKVSPAATYQLPDYGLGDAWRGDPIGRRAVERTVIDTHEDWLALPRLDPGAGFTGRLVASVGLVRRQLPADVPVIITVFDPLFQAVTLAGLNRLRRHMSEYPNAVLTGLDILRENTLALIRSLIAQQLDGIFVASQHAEAAVFSDDDFVRFGLPGDLACLQAARGLPFNMLHLHGAAVHRRLFDDLRHVTLHYDASLANPDPRDVLADGGSVATGPAPAFLGSMATPSDIRGACDALLAACKGKGFILSPGCSVPLAVDGERLDAVTAAARSARPDRMRI
jgi:uroporphyrinogen decarboxylase